MLKKKQNGKVKLHQMYNLTASGAVGGGFWGVLIGLIFMNPLLGLVVGAGAGAVAGALSDVGINDDFMKQLAEKLTPGTSALFVLVDSDLTDKVLDALRGEVPGLIPVLPDGSKVARAYAVTPLWAGGNVWIPEDDAVWTRDFVEELVAFPAGAHDDQVDAMTQALRYLRSHGLAVWEALADD